MTRIECMEALRPHPHEAVVLAVVAHVHEVALTRCAKDARTAVVGALNSALRWVLGVANQSECRAAADAAYADAAYAAAAASDAYSHAAYAAAYAAADAADAAAYAVYSAVYSADAADYAAYAAGAAAGAESRAKLVARLGMPRAWGPPVRLVRGGVEVIVAGEYVWTCPEGTLEYVEGRPTEGAAAVLYDECKEAA